MSMMQLLLMLKWTDIGRYKDVGFVSQDGEWKKQGVAPADLELNEGRRTRQKDQRKSLVRAITLLNEC